MENKPQEDSAEPVSKAKNMLSSYARYSALAFQMIAIIGGFTYAGYKIDERRGADTPLATAFLSLAGVFISLYLVIRSLKNQKP